MSEIIQNAHMMLFTTWPGCLLKRVKVSKLGEQLASPELLHFVFAAADYGIRITFYPF